MLTCEVLSEIHIKTHNGIKTIPPGKIFETSNIKAADSLVKSRKIKILSTDINDLSAKQSPQCPQSPQTKEYQRISDADIDMPKSVMSACRDAAADRSRKNLSAANNMNHWNDEMQELIAWFRAAPRPTQTFLLANHMRVINPEKFFAALEREIEAGQRSPRARTGALQSDLLAVRNYMENEYKKMIASYFKH